MARALSNAIVRTEFAKAEMVCPKSPRDMANELYGQLFLRDFCDAKQAVRRSRQAHREFDGHTFDDLQRLFESRGDKHDALMIGHRIGRHAGTQGMRTALDIYRMLLFEIASRAKLSPIDATIAIARILRELSENWKGVLDWTPRASEAFG